MQIRNCQGIHIAIDLILSTHAPAERVVFGSNTGMNRPAGGNDDLFIGDHDVARLLARTHQVNHALAGLKVEVEVNFRPPHVRMRRHGVPDTSGGEPRKAHHQLAAPGSLQVNEFGYLPQIPSFGSAKRHLSLFGRANELRRMRRMSRITQQVELRYLGSIGAGEYNLFISTANVESVQLVKLEWNAVHADHARTPDIQDAQFTPLGKVRGLERLVGRQGQWLAHWYCRADHSAVKIDIRQSNLSRTKEIVDKKGLAQFFRGHPSIANRIRHLQYFHWLILSFYCPRFNCPRGLLSRYARTRSAFISNNDTTAIRSHV